MFDVDVIDEQFLVKLEANSFKILLQVMFGTTRLPAIVLHLDHHHLDVHLIPGNRLKNLIKKTCHSILEIYKTSTNGVIDSTLMLAFMNYKSNLKT